MKRDLRLAPQTAGTSADSAADQRSRSVSLPKLQILKFGGKLRDRQRFCEHFEAATTTTSLLPSSRTSSASSQILQMMPNAPSTVSVSATVATRMQLQLSRSCSVGETSYPLCTSTSCYPCIQYTASCNNVMQLCFSTTRCLTVQGAWRP